MSRPGNIGILSYEFYIPNTYVNQTEFEAFNKEGKGKYSSGLGQLEMAAVGDREDINSIAATVLINLLEKNSIPASNIGRLEVGTETFQDKSKSTKTFLMDYLQGNSSVEGITAVNACYGAIQALFNSVAWIESSSWDGRLAIVIAADIAIYEAGPARATGGAGAVALLIGPNAPLVLEPLRSTYMENAWDFYKPIPSSEYPVVDGQFSLKCYLKAISECFRSLKQKTGISNVQNLADFYCFHAPYMKLTLKSFTHIVTEEMK
jgi:hydroxymethylglutaryl-CoA synthase